MREVKIKKLGEAYGYLLQDFNLDHYQLFGLSRSATPDEIKGAYKKLRIFFEDFSPVEHYSDIRDRDCARAYAKKVQEAYLVLLNDAEKKKYDEKPPASALNPRFDYAAWLSEINQVSENLPEWQSNGTVTLKDYLISASIADRFSLGWSGGKHHYSENTLIYPDDKCEKCQKSMTISEFVSTLQKNYNGLKSSFAPFRFFQTSFAQNAIEYAKGHQNQLIKDSKGESRKLADLSDPQLLWVCLHYAENKPNSRMARALKKTITEFKEKNGVDIDMRLKRPLTGKREM